MKKISPKHWQAPTLYTSHNSMFLLPRSKAEA